MTSFPASPFSRLASLRYLYLVSLLSCLFSFVLIYLVLLLLDTHVNTNFLAGTTSSFTCNALDTSRSHRSTQKSCFSLPGTQPCSPSSLPPCFFFVRASLSLRMHSETLYFALNGDTRNCSCWTSLCCSHLALFALSTMCSW